MKAEAFPVPKTTLAPIALHHLPLTGSEGGGEDGGGACLGLGWGKSWFTIIHMENNTVINK